MRVDDTSEFRCEFAEFSGVALGEYDTSDIAAKFAEFGGVGVRVDGT